MLIRRRGWLKSIVIIIISGFMLAVGAVLGAALYIAHALQPMPPKHEDVQIQIVSGMNSADIAEVLEESGLIRDAAIFRYYINFKGKGSRMQAGDYAMKPGLTIDEIVDKLENGDVIAAELVTVTIPEGFTAAQVAARIGSFEQWDEAKVLALINDKTAVQAGIAKHIPDDDRLLHALEGYLFPETYHMRQEWNEQEVIESMLRMTEQKLTALPSGWEQQLEKLGITFHEMMTIASLIEREVVVDAERPIVASVIYNRLNIDMLLQIDATVQYAHGEQKDVLYLDDLEIDNPYNTYEYKGLPPGPIASPGLKSIEAALYPEQTPYFYYVTKKDGSREHWFAETHEEHVRNKNRSAN